MSRKHVVLEHIITPCLVTTAPPHELLERTEDPVYLTRTCIADRYGLAGVPGRLFDIAIDRRLTDEDYTAGHVRAEVVRKAGRYGGEVRDRLSLRLYTQGDKTSTDTRLHALRVCEFVRPGDQTRNVTEVRIVRTDDGAEVWRAEYARQRCEVLTPEGSDAILWWHHSRYFAASVSREDAESLAAEFRAEVILRAGDRPLSLTEANRYADRMLYRAARNNGWRKLTLRERKKLGIDGGPWVSPERYDAARARLGHATGCGEYTLSAAREDFSTRYDALADSVAVSVRRR
jgi:hypothetical protein